jgi:diacylglycerol kinase family enzyme
MAMEFHGAVVVAGGDGTLFHLLCRLPPPWPSVVLVPNGRGNALARDIGRGREACIDAMRVRAARAAGGVMECFAFSSVGLGYPADVTRRAMPLRWLRRLSYACAAVFTPPRWSEYGISLDGEPPRRVRLRGVLVNNTRYTGGFEALPRASSSDGEVECLELTAGYLSQMAHNLSAISGLHCYAPVRVRRIRSARIQPAAPMQLMIDGEVLEEVERLELEVVPRALKIRIAGALRNEGLSAAVR